VDEINRLRANLGLTTLTRWTEQEAYASAQAQQDAASGTAHGAFGQCSEHAQNDCPGWPSPATTMIKDCLAMMWVEGPGADFSKRGHFFNMSSTTYQKAACGF
jgi:hypothetical protein